MNKSKTAETRTGAMSNWGWSTGTSGYDDEDRLVSWTRDDNNLSQSWTLTNEGDWSQFVENTNTENRTHGPAHELTAIGSTALSYDPKGNLTVDNTKSHNYTWDFDNRMSAADTDGDNTDDVTLQYDALGRRIAKTAGTSAVVYVSMTQPIQYSPFAGQVVAEYASGAAPASPTERYVYASYIDEPVLKDGTGGTVYYHRNSQYSVSALTSASGAVVERYGYEPYGELTILAVDGTTVRASSSYANSFTYTGRRWDAELKLYYFRARYCDPGLGRFVGRDPLGYVDGWNRYADAWPTTFVDPAGLCRVCSSGIRYRVNIAALDAFQVGTPYQDLAKFAWTYLAREPAHRVRHLVPPILTHAGPFKYDSAAFRANGGLDFPAGTWVAGHYLVFVDWDICEADGPCRLRVSETITFKRDGGQQQTTKNGPTMPRLGNAWTKSQLKVPVGNCNQTLIYVDAPDAFAQTIPVQGTPASGFTLSVDAKLEVIDERTGRVVDVTLLQVKVSVDKMGNLSASP